MYRSEFRVIEKAGERKAVYSLSDLSYMMRRGWREVDLTPRPVEAAPVAQIVVEPRVKRKYTRRK
jgi:hypothetical protein